MQQAGSNALKGTVMARSLGLGLAVALVGLVALFVLATRASADTPTHPTLSPDPYKTGYALICGTATDSEGDLYISDFVTKEVHVFSPAGAALASFSTTADLTGNPCQLAVDSEGKVYALTSTRKELVKFAPSEFPPTGTTTWSADTSLNENGKLAFGVTGGDVQDVAVDPATDDVYIAEDAGVEVQEYTLPATAEYTLTTEGAWCAGFCDSRTFPVGATNATIQTGLREIACGGANCLSVVNGVPSTTHKRITFAVAGSLANTDIPPIEVTPEGGSPEPTRELFDGSAVDRVRKVAADGSLLSKTIGDSIAGADYQGVGVYAKNGNVYVTDKAASKAYVLNSAGDAVLASFDGSDSNAGAFSFSGTALPDLAVDQSNGHVYVSDITAHAVVDEFDGAGNFVSELSHNPALEDTSVAGPNTIAVDSGSSSPNPGVVYVSTGFSPNPASVVAFGPLTYGKSLAVLKDGPGTGTVSGGSVEQPSAIDCGSTCTASFPDDAEVVLTPTPDPGSAFGSWAGCDSVDGDECHVTLSDHKTVTATFVTRLLSVSKSGSGDGSITSEPSGIDCGSTCESYFDDGTGVTLTHDAEIGSKFRAWTGCDSIDVDDKCIVTMDDDNSVDAEFVAEPSITAVESSNVGTAGATLKARVNPNGDLTTWHFEYVDDAEFQADGFENAIKTPEPDFSAGAGSAPGAVSRAITGLVPSTTYHFRLVASNFASPVEGTGGPSATFKTYETASSVHVCPNDSLRTGPAAKLPDCRAYEQVSPVDKNGIDVLGRPNAMSASVDGEAVIYYSLIGQTEGGGPAGFPVSLAQRKNDGWAVSALMPPVSYGNFASILGWLPDFKTVFSGGSGLSSNKFFLSRESVDGSLNTISTVGFPTRILGASADGSIVYFFASKEVGVPLAPGAVPNKPNVYVWNRDTNSLNLAGVLPESACGSPPCVSAEGSTIQSTYSVADHVVSEEGDAYFTDPGTGQLYLRRDPFDSPSTGHVSASQKTNGPGPGGVAGNSPQPATFQGATSDGAYAFFTSTEELTDDAYTGPEPVVPPQPPIAIGRADLDGTSQEPEFIPASADWLAVDSGYVYWSNTSDGTIGRAEIDGANPDPEFIAGLNQPEAVAVDSGHIYWAEARDRSEGSGTIGRADLNGGNIDKNFVTSVGDPHGVALSPDSASPRYIYWTSGTSTDIGRAEINAGNPDYSFIVREQFQEPWGIAVNATNIYWVVNGNGVSNTLQRSDLNGGSVSFKQIFSDPKGIALSAAHTYFVEPDFNRITRRSLSLEGPEQIVNGIEAFAGVAVDAGHLYWSANPPVVSPLASPGNDLYRYDAETSELIDIAPESGKPFGAEVQAYLGSSSDGDYVYFVANADLDDAGPAEAGDCAGKKFGFDPDGFQGECSIYLSHNGEITFVARLDLDENTGDGGESDAANWKVAEGGVLAGRSARVGADGKTLLFRSQRQLTSYENNGPRCVKPKGGNVTLGEGPCTELYRYHVDEGLSCVSCNPTGAAPTWPAQISQINPGNGVPSITSQSQLRGLSGDGNRVFFESADKLIADDVNGESSCPLVPVAASNLGKVPACLDVYMWEAEGTGSCESSSQNGGCLYLISSGTGSEPAFFLDASADGDEAFFFTQEKLVPGDVDGLRDVYVASVDGGLASQHAAAPPQCQGDGCRGAASSPDRQSSAGTAEFVGPGNPPASAKKPRRCPKGKRKVRAKNGKVRCVKRRRKHRNQKHRRKRTANPDRRAGR